MSSSRACELSVESSPWKRLLDEWFELEYVRRGFGILYGELSIPAEGETEDRYIEYSGTVEEYHYKKDFLD